MHEKRIKMKKICLFLIKTKEKALKRAKYYIFGDKMYLID